MATILFHPAGSRTRHCAVAVWFRAEIFFAVSRLVRREHAATIALEPRAFRRDSPILGAPHLGSHPRGLVRFALAQKDRSQPHWLADPIVVVRRWIGHFKF